jgi:tetratricopeptide (TPR) repeat protein
MQAAFDGDRVEIAGEYKDFARISDESDRKEHVFHFCPECGSQVFYTEPSEPGLVVVSVGAFADSSFPQPTESGYDSRRYSWIGLPETVRTWAPEVWDEARPLYEAGDYGAAADRGKQLIEERPLQPELYFNVACCESLAGRAPDAIEHLRQAIDLWSGFRDMARGDSDFDPIRSEPGFVALLAD